MLAAIWNISADAAAVAVGAAAAALIAAVTAQARLRAQLRHDRDMREREATREALNGAVDEIREAAGPMTSAAGAVHKLYRGHTSSIGSIEIEEAEEEVRDEIERLRERQVPLMTAIFRVHLRFPDSHPIIARLAEWRATFEQLADVYELALESTRPAMEERFQTARETGDRLGQQLNDFLAVARDWGTEPCSRPG